MTVQYIIFDDIQVQYRFVVQFHTVECFEQHTCSWEHLL
jgi:hypothetical protein